MGVAGQSAHLTRDAEDRVVQLAFTRPISCEAGDRLVFRECSSLDSSTSFDVVNVRGGRHVEVAACACPAGLTTLDSGIAEWAAAVAAPEPDAEPQPTAAEEQDAPSSGGAWEEDRSTDGSDTEGSLVDFIAADDDSDDDGVPTTPHEEEEEEQMQDPQAEVQELVADFPYDKALLEEDAGAAGGLRRSRRQRAPVTRYQDDNYERMMMEDVSDMESSAAEEDEEEGGQQQEEDEEDDEYAGCSDDAEDSDEASESDYVEL